MDSARARLVSGKAVVFGALVVALVGVASPATSFHGVSPCSEWYGTPGDDTNGGSLGCDHSYAREGNDTIAGWDDRDGLQGEAGNDAIYGQNNNDTLHGQSGADYLNGGPGNNDVCVHGGDPGDNKVECEA